MSKVKYSRTSMRGNSAFCHICGLKIPEGIVDPDHMLFGTVDHVVPLSKGGLNRHDNRRPAHRFCNVSKGSKDLRLGQRLHFHGEVRRMLKEFGVQLTNRKVAEARRRAGLVDLTNPGKKSNLPKLKARGFTIAQWEDDGGAVQLS